MIKVSLGLDGSPLEVTLFNVVDVAGGSSICHCPRAVRPHAWMAAAWHPASLCP